ALSSLSTLSLHDALPIFCPMPWQLVANMPLDLYGAGAASNGTFSYHAGGYSFSFPGTVNVFNRYDPVANTWTALAPMPDTLTLRSEEHTSELQSRVDLVC